ncbi:hypothetical protein [Mycobacteroides abscessus]|uniref:hypothetical protein n=1 Tax=Mycobacteroides abscessus TaxID=36809 RepID=UPI00078EC476|nr:hypothetical protein [Mycobacteroides abscessus]AMU20848.1 hypothetical protein A3N95_08545 [Mycobacteroides abscessus]
MSDFIPDRYSAADEMYGLAGWTPLGQFIDVQVGTDFTADCDCGWSLKTKDSDQLESDIQAHTDETGHIWPTPYEAPDWW